MFSNAALTVDSREARDIEISSRAILLGRRGFFGIWRGRVKALADVVPFVLLFVIAGLDPAIPSSSQDSLKRDGCPDQVRA
jgi:hypothetical protein